MSNYKFYPNPYGSQEKAIKLIGSDKTVLEIGTASGYVTKRLKENNCKVYGIEINSESSRKADKFCVEMLNADIEHLQWLPFSCDKFDVILMGDVLEHLKEPQKTLEKVKPYLNEDGVIIASIPNVTYWSNRLKILFGNFNYTPSGLLDKTHLRFFTYKTAKKLFEDSGYRIIHKDFVPMGLFPLLTYPLAIIRPNLFAWQFIIMTEAI